MPRMNLEDLGRRTTVSITEAGQLLGVGRNTAYEAAKNGEIPTLKIGNKSVVPVSKLLAMLGQESSGARADPLEDLGNRVKDQSEIQPNRTPLQQYFIERIVKGDEPEAIMAEVLEAIAGVPGILEQYRKTK